MYDLLYLKRCILALYYTCSTRNYIFRDSEFNISFITPFEVRKIIYNLDINKSTGNDGIGPKILKHCGDTITTCIASIIKNSVGCYYR